MPKRRVVKVRCRCGRILFKYYKGGRGRLIKCILDEIREDYCGILDTAPSVERPVCPACGKELGIIRIARGHPALKINQGTIHVLRI